MLIHLTISVTCEGDRLRITKVETVRWQMSSARNIKEEQIFCALNVSCQLMTLPPQYDDIKDRENTASFVIIITVPVGHCLSSIAYSTTVQCSSSSSSNNKPPAVSFYKWRGWGWKGDGVRLLPAVFPLNFCLLCRHSLIFCTMTRHQVYAPTIYVRYIADHSPTSVCCCYSF